MADSFTDSHFYVDLFIRGISVNYHCDLYRHPDISRYGNLDPKHRDILDLQCNDNLTGMKLLLKRW